MPSVLLSLLGGFEARAADGRALLLPKKTRALLAYLALGPRQTYLRTDLAALLWGDSTDDQALQSLRQALSHLRRDLGPEPVLAIDARSVRLDRQRIDVDALAFQRLAAESRGHPGEAGAKALVEAAALYRGHLLAGLDVREAPFEEWLVGERERLHEMAMNSLTRLLAHQTRARTLGEAVVTASRIVTLDPLHEPAHRALMQIYAEQGRRPAALRQYQTCVAMLRRELGVDPDAATKQLYAEILHERVAPVAEAAGDASAAGDRAPRAPAAEAVPFVGRVAELGRARRATAEAFAGRSRVIAIGGEAGIGKTRLAGEIAAEAAWQDARVLVGRAYRTEQILPFSPWTDALRNDTGSDVRDAAGGLLPVWRAELARVLPELRTPVTPVTSAEDPARLFEAMVALVERLALTRPLVVVLEDLQWADDMSVRLLGFLTRRLERRRVLVVVTIREEDVVDAPAIDVLLSDLDREERLVRIALGALSEAEISSLVRSAVRPRPAPTVDTLAGRVWRASEGNPFLATEMIQALEEGTTAETPAALPLPDRVRQVVAARLQRLDARVRDLLAVAAVIGRDVDFALLQRAAGLDDGAAATGVEELVRRRLLRSVGERFEFPHDWIRDVVYGDLLLPRRRLLHRRAAEALLALHGAAVEPHTARLGIHYDEADLPAEAVDYLRRAGAWALARSANREAAACFARALGAVRRLPDGAATVALGIDVRLESRNALVLLGEFEQARQSLEEARDLAEAIADRGRLGRVMTQLAFHHYWVGDVTRIEPLAAAALAHGEATGDRQLTATATICRAYACHRAGDHRRVIDILGTLAQRLTDRLARERFGQHLFPYVVCRAHLAYAGGHLGDFPAAIVCAEEAARFAETVDHRYSAVWASWALGEVYVVKGDADAAGRHLEHAIGLCRDWEITLAHASVVGCLGYARALAGRAGEAQALLEEALGEHERRRFVLGRSRLLIMLGEAHLLASRVGAAREYAARAVHFAREHGEPGIQAWALRLMGDVGARGRRSEQDAAWHDLEASLALAAERGMRPTVARCHLGLGRLSLARGQREQAREHLAAAVAMLTEMDMARWLDEALADLATS